MIHNLKVIFIHGVNNQTTNYSSNLYQKILSACRTKLRSKGLSEDNIHQLLNKSVQHEVMWTDVTTDLTNRYLQLQYEGSRNFFWDAFKKPIDPLAIQIMQYIKDKGDIKTGRMNILRKMHTDMEDIFSWEDLGENPGPKEGNKAIVVAHSLGSVIAFDYIMGFRKEYNLKNLKKDITLKSFITMGSPLPLFITAMGHPDSDLSLPPYIKKWVNIISSRDGIARYMQPYFRNILIDEQRVSTGFLPISAHTGYWDDVGTAKIIAGELLDALDIK